MAQRILETERLYLEILTESHIDDLYSLLSNKNVQRYFPKVLDFKESKEFLSEVQMRYQRDGVCFWGVFLKESNQFVGICGILKHIIDETEEFEIAYRFSDSYWGKGYASEAAQGVLNTQRIH